MPIKVIRQDITKIECDAIVNPSDERLTGCGGLDKVIHDVAGNMLAEQCRKLGGVKTGEAKLTRGFNLPCKHVIHTAGPIWQGGDQGEDELLASCYTSCLKLAKAHRFRSVAFPVISSGSYGYPKDRAMKIAIKAIGDFVFENEMLIYLVVYDKSAYCVSEKLFAQVESFIDDAYVSERAPRLNASRMVRTDRAFEQMAACASTCAEDAPKDTKSLDEMLEEMDKGFAETLFYYIDKKGLSDVECYKKANVDKKTFSKIKCNKSYKPSKVTAVSFAIALRLDIDETNHLLRTVGMTLSRSSKFDVIIEYFITSGNYESIFDVNETLFQFDQVMLGV